MRETETRRNIYGDYITYFKDDYVGRKIQADGVYEKDELDLLVGILNAMEDPVVLDIGANIGNHTLVFSRYAHAVYSFEPIKEIFSVLVRNVNQNNINNVHAFNKALSNHDEQRTIYVNRSGNLGASSLHRRLDESEESAIDLVRGDDFLSRLGVEGVDLIKIDVEGHEFSVIEGLENRINHSRPILIMEGNDEETVRGISDNALSKFFPEYHAFSVSSNYDRRYWRGKYFWRARRRLFRWRSPKEVKLFELDPTRVSKSILLVPQERRGCLPHGMF